MTKRTSRRRIVFVILLIILALLLASAIVFILDHRAHAPAKQASSSTSSDQTASATPSSQASGSFDKTKYPTTDASSLWVIVNKQHPLSPVDYTPADLVTLYGHQVSSKMSTDLQAMVAAAAKDGAHLTLASSYRSYSYQVNLYNSYVSQDGQAKADTYSARPGYSEHQTGLAIDFGDSAGTCLVADCYSNTPEGKWLAAHAYQYGFILRYTPANQSVTGYESEPWHYRYVGRELAGEMHKENISTLEEFFGVSGGPNYN